MPPAAASTSTRVVLSQWNVPSASGASVGTVYADTATRATGMARLPARSDHLADLVLQHRLDDVPPVLLAADQGLGEPDRLLGGRVPGHRRLVRVHHALHHGRAGPAERLADDALC